MTEKYSMEEFVRVYDDTHGCYYEIRPDADGLGCVGICYSDGEQPAKQELAIPPAMARLVAAAIIKVADSITDPS